MGMMDRRRRMIAAQPHIETISGDIAHFETDLSAPLKSCRIDFLPDQGGTGDPSPTNIRPIFGYSKIDAYHYGNSELSNITPLTNVQSGLTWTVDENGIITADGTPTAFSSTGTFARYNVKGSETIYEWILGNEDKLVANDTGRIYVNGDFVAVQSGWEVQANLNNPASVNFANYPGAASIRMNVKRYYNNRYLHKRCLVVVGENLQKPSLYSIQLPNTFYGGYVDLVKGALVQEWEMQSARWGDIIYGSQHETTGYYTGRLNFSNPIKIIHSSEDYGVNTVCNVLNKVSWSDASRVPEHYYGGNNASTGLGVFYIFGNFDSDLIIQIAVKLNTPIEIPLTPIAIKTLRGINNIWSDAGTVSLSYWTH